jgi:undecaprenyl-diphosphatase
MNFVAIVQAAILGLIEGLTEFLPISSSGHLIVASSALGFNDPNKTFEVVIQLGAILAVIWYYRLEIIKRVTGLFGNNLTDRKFWINIVIATLPALILIPLEKPIKALLFKPVPVAIALIVGGIVLWLVEQRFALAFTPQRSVQPAVASGVDGLRETLRQQRVSQRDGKVHLDAITTREAIVIGMAQVLAAIFPGTSRSGATIVGAMLCGLNRPTAAAFSFFLGIPVLLGGGLLDLYQSRDELGAVSGGVPAIVVGTVVSFISALLVINWLLKFIAKNDFKVFAIYRVALGAIILALVSFGWLQNV